MAPMEVALAWSMFLEFLFGVTLFLLLYYFNLFVYLPYANLMSQRFSYLSKCDSKLDSAVCLYYQSK